MTELPNFLPVVPDPEPISFTYLLGEHGWASVDLAIGDRAFSIGEFGYMTDGLGDLVRAALQIATGDTYAGVIFDNEPHRWGLALEPAGLSRDNVRIARLTIRDGGRALSDDGYSKGLVWQWASLPVAFEGYVTTDAFAHAILDITRQAREQYDDATYRDRWGHYGSLEGFPLRGLRALETALSITEYRE